MKNKPEPNRQTRPLRYRPPHCPWPECEHHELAPHRPYRCHRHGSYTRKHDPRPVPRFRCLACKRTFSQATFSTRYYLKRPELSEPIAAGLVAGSAHRQLARSLRCSHTTVTRRAARLGRHALLYSAQALGFLGPIREPIVFDHFETFELTQNLPAGIGTAVGHGSWFVYDIDPAPHHRTGRMSKIQKVRMKKLYRRVGKPPRNAYPQSFRRVLDRLLDLAKEGLRLVTDDHKAYSWVLKRHPKRGKVDHRIYPNPKRGPKGSPRSPEARERDEAMFPVDLLHGLLRHTCANHKRETIALGRRINALMERMFLVMVWRNFIKGRSERKPERRTPAMYLGLTDQPKTWRQVLSSRLFPARIEVPEGWMKIYRREWVTKAIGINGRHDLVNAF